MFQTIPKNLLLQKFLMFQKNQMNLILRPLFL